MTTAEQRRGTKSVGLLTRFRRWEASGVLVALIALCVALGAADPVIHVAI